MSSTTVPTLLFRFISLSFSCETLSDLGQYLSASFKCISAMLKSIASNASDANSQSDTALSIFSNLKPHLHTFIVASLLVPHFGHLISNSSPHTLQTFLPSDTSFVQPHLHIFICLFSFFSTPDIGTGIFSTLQNDNNRFSASFLFLKISVSLPA